MVLFTSEIKDKRVMLLFMFSMIAFNKNSSKKMWGLGAWFQLPSMLEPLV